MAPIRAHSCRKSSRRTEACSTPRSTSWSRPWQPIRPAIPASIRRVSRRRRTTRRCRTPSRRPGTSEGGAAAGGLARALRPPTSAVTRRQGCGATRSVNLTCQRTRQAASAFAHAGRDRRRHVAFGGMSGAPEAFVGEALKQIRRQNAAALGISNLAGNAVETRHAELNIECLAVLVAHVVEVMVETRQSAFVINEFDSPAGLPREVLVVDDNEPIGMLAVERLPQRAPSNADRAARTGKGVHTRVHVRALGRLEHP